MCLLGVGDVDFLTYYEVGLESATAFEPSRALEGPASAPNDYSF